MYQKNDATLDQFTVLSILGSGFTSSVYLVKDEHSRIYAAKKFRKDKVEEYFNNQINIMKMLVQENEHENLVKIYEVRQEAQFIDECGKKEKCAIILMEYANGGQLYDYIVSTGKFSQDIARVFFHQIMSALQYMHKKGIAHRDLKPQNILLTKQFKIKITDFGFSCATDKQPLKESIGTTAYKAPQIYKQQYNGHKVDLFAVGAILFSMIFGVNPFSSIADIRYKFISQKNYPKFWKSFNKEEKIIKSSEAFKSIFLHLVSSDPDQRPSIQQIFNHQWMCTPLIQMSHLSLEFQKRLLFIQQIKEKKMMEQNHKRDKLMKQANQIHGVRGSGVELEQESLLDIYCDQIVKQREVNPKQIMKIDDLLLQQNHVIALTFLKQFLHGQKIPRSDSDDEHLTQKLTELQDLETSIRLKYIQEQYLAEQSVDITISQTQIIISFGYDSTGLLVFSFEEVTDKKSEIYSKKKIKEIEQLYNYCKIKNDKLAICKKLE